jgi:hypothetical protein
MAAAAAVVTNELVGGVDVSAVVEQAERTHDGSLLGGESERGPTGGVGVVDQYALHIAEQRDARDRVTARTTQRG